MRDIAKSFILLREAFSKHTSDIYHMKNPTAREETRTLSHPQARAFVSRKGGILVVPAPASASASAQVVTTTDS